MPRLRSFTLVVVGDEASKKTELLLKYTTSRVPIFNPRPFAFVNNIQEVILDRIPYLIYLINAQSDDSYKTLRLYDYSKAHCFLLCYSIANKTSFESISTKWCIEVRKHCLGIPIILVGIEKELRQGFSSHYVSKEEGENLRYLIGATYFVECSLEDCEEMNNIFLKVAKSLVWKKRR